MITTAATRSWKACEDRSTCSVLTHRFIPNIGWQHLVLTGCPDSGTCHHDCGDSCFRVVCCAPLGIARYPGDRWPENIRRIYGGTA